MNHLQIYDNALPKESCRNIIKYFDNNPNVEKDLIMDAYGHIHSTRTWMDLSILGDVKFSYSRLSESFDSLHSPLDLLIPTLVKGITKYKKKFPFIEEITEWDLHKHFNIQKFDGEKNGYFMRHCEADGPYTERILTWMIYLNNAKSGTRFYYPRRDVKAKEGRLVIWPADWTYPHSGITPNKGEKYLMTGWWTFKEYKE